jgi:hypothetical protein
VAAEAQELRVLDLIGAGSDTVPKAAAALGLTEQAVHDVVQWALSKGLVTVDGDRFTLTPQGVFVTTVRDRTVHAMGPDGKIDLPGIAGTFGEAWAAARYGADEVEQAQQQGMLVGDQEREATVQSLEEHYAAGRIDLPELERRTQAALTAATRADLAKAGADLPVAAPRRVDVPGLLSRAKTVRSLVTLLVVGVLALGVLAELLRAR